MSLKGHNALVTGSGRSLGRAIAVRLAAEGANVVVNSRSTLGEGESVAKECREQGVRSIAVAADVSLAPGIDLLRDTALREFEFIDIVVNNVGISPYLPFLEISDTDLNTVFGVNLGSMFMCCRVFLPCMVDRHWGRIVNVTGQAARRHGVEARGTGAHVAATKAAARALTRSIAAEFGPNGITCNELGPGRMNTEPRRNKYYEDRKASETRELEAPDVPVGRIGTPEEFAAACAFLASEEASYITGQSLLVNGGAIFN